MSVDINTLKDAQAKGLTVGVVPKSGQTALRLEIDDFIVDKELANLYFLALEAFMANDIYKQPFSYYEISGIHGQPFRPWDGVTSANFQPTGSSPAKDWGYCAHGSVLFPLWHRAYLAQFEQALFLHAAEIAPKLSVEPVLDRFRIPYFDPFLPRQMLVNTDNYKYGIPVILTLPQIQVRRPENPTQWVPMDNPLYKFKFPQADIKSIIWNSRGLGENPNKAVTENTIRGYDSSVQAANHSFVMETFDNNYNPNAALSSSDPGSIWRVLLDNQNWMTMSNHFDATNRRASNYNLNSLEGFHDDIHSYMGAGPNSNSSNVSGHMAWPEYAGFDPVFWLHHCNVDRLSAIWQGIHSNDDDSVAWWTSELHVQPTFVEPAGEKETPTTPLVPFRRAFDQAGTPIWWQSVDLRDWRKLGYEYPQTVAARQSGDLAGGLTAWANQELGWASPQNPGLPDQQALINLQNQITELVPAFPNPMEIDGTTPFSEGEVHISSNPAQPVAAEAMTISVPVLSQKVLKRAIPTSKPSFQDRFGNLGDLVSQGKMTQWNTSFGVEKYALDGSFTIYFFLGDFSAETGTWLHEPHLAGSSSIFASSRTTIESGSCSNCSKNDASKLKYYDSVGLTQALLVYWRSGEAVNGLRITSLEPDVVVPFLTRNLHWRVLKAGGEHVPRETIPSLKVMVYSETVQLPQQLTDKPLFENQVAHPEITDGRPGGLNQGESL